MAADAVAPLRQTLADLLSGLRKSAGLTQQQLGNRVGYSRVTVALAVAARRQHASRLARQAEQERDARVSYWRTTGVSISLGRPGPMRGTGGAPSYLGAAGGDWELSLEDEGEAEAVRRDEFLRLGALAVGSLLAPPLVHDWEPAGERADELNDAVISDLRAQTEGYRWLDRQEGAWAHLPGAARHARRLVERWQSADAGHPLRRQLAELAADACHLVAYQAFDQGRRALACRVVPELSRPRGSRRQQGPVRLRRLRCCLHARHARRC